MDNLISDYKRRLHGLGQVYERSIFKSFKTDHRIVGIVGSRGIGKTTYMLHYLKTKYLKDSKTLYVSADDLYFTDHKLIDLVEQFINIYDGKLLCIDEIHKYPNWAQELKNIYDKYQDFKIIFSGSSSIDLIHQKYDLSRRAVLKHLPGFSFREFLEMKLQKSLPIFTLKDIINHRIDSLDQVTDIPKLLGLFKQYLHSGYYPIFKEYSNQQDYFTALMGIIEKVVYIDLASYFNLKTSTLPIFKKLLYFIYTSSPSSININRLALSLKKDHSDIANYHEMMRSSGLLRFLIIDKLGHAMIRNTEKVFLNNPNLAYALENDTGKPADIGSLRELFVLTCLENANLKPLYSKIGDMKCDKYIFEIGGQNKNAGQIRDQKDAYLVKDDIIYGSKKAIPMYLFGFLY